MRSMMQLAVAGAVLASGPVAASKAAIVPSWRENEIRPAAIAANPALHNAYSVSLMVELTGGSTFNVAGLDLTSALPGAAYFNPRPQNSPVEPVSPGPWPFPDLAYDTSVSTTSAVHPALPGRFRGPGEALVGNGGFNVAWGAIPNTGGDGLFEIARITVFGVCDQPVVLTPVDGALVDATGLRTPLPPMPFPVPEPAAGVVLAVMTAAVCRRARRYVD